MHCHPVRFKREPGVVLLFPRRKAAYPHSRGIPVLAYISTSPDMGTYPPRSRALTRHNDSELCTGTILRNRVHRCGRPDAVQTFNTFICSIPTEQSKPGTPEVKVEVWVS